MPFIYQCHESRSPSSSGCLVVWFTNSLVSLLPDRMQLCAGIPESALSRGPPFVSGHAPLGSIRFDFFFFFPSVPHRRVNRDLTSPPMLPQAFHRPLPCRMVFMRMRKCNLYLFSHSGDFLQGNNNKNMNKKNKHQINACCP